MRASLLGTPTILLTARAVAGRLGVNRETIYRLAARGDLPVVYVGGAVRFAADDVAGFLARQGESAP
jgi:excisionase family DNA binding protein